MTSAPNKPAAGNAGIAPRLTIGHHCPGVPEPERLGELKRMKLLSTLFRIGGWGALAGAAITMVVGVLAFMRGTPDARGVAIICLISFVGNFTLGAVLLLIARGLRRGTGTPPTLGTTQLGTAPNGGPATSFSNSEAAEGPPSVS